MRQVDASAPVHHRRAAARNRAGAARARDAAAARRGRERAARRVAAERGEAIGQSVGYHVAGDRRGAPAAGEVDEAALDEELDAYRREGKDDDDDDEEELKAVPAAQGSVNRPAKCVYMTTGVYCCSYSPITETTRP